MVSTSARFPRCSDRQPIQGAAPASTERALCFYFEIEDLRHDTILSRSTPGLEPARRDDAGSRTAASRAEGAEGAARHVRHQDHRRRQGRSQ